MKSDITYIWGEILNCLENEVTKIGYDTWIKTVLPLEISDDAIVLGVDSEIHKNYVGNRYKTLIENAIKQVTSRALKIEVVLTQEHETTNLNKSNASLNNNRSYSSGISDKYTFDSFVIGNSNKFAHAFSVAVAENPGKAYNPFFIYGGSGLGKTHLMHAVANYILSQTPNKRVLYVTSETFTNDLINAIKNNKNEQFRERYRNNDVLLIDDIQFIGGRDKTQEELFHTFNTLHDSEKQIIISSDKSPKEMKHFEERLISRFEQGLTADIQQPDIETRIAILRKKAQIKNFSVNDDVLIYIADKMPSNVRDMEGALNKIIAYSSLYKGELTVDIIPEALKDIIEQGSKHTITCNVIIDHVSRYFDIHVEDFRSKKRSRDITYPRQIAMYLCRKMTDISLPKIGDFFGGRDHTTVMHACEKIGNEYKESSETQKTIDELGKIINGK